MKKIRIYIAGKVSKESVFGTHYWRDEFCHVIEKLSGFKLVNLDPTRSNIDQSQPEFVFGGDAYMIKKSELVIAYLTDDISVGCSQELLIAKYFEKPVIGLAPLGGKFNGCTKQYFGKTIKNYKDPFVFSTCDVVVKDIEEVAEAVKMYKTIKPKSINLIDSLSNQFEKQLGSNEYIKKTLENE